MKTPAADLLLRPFKRIPYGIHPLNWICILVLILSIILAVVAGFYTGMTKPYTLDETDITLRAEYILKRGPEVFNDGTHYLAHPPLYEYTVALIFRLFGQDEVPVRLFGLICHLLSAIFFALILSFFLKKNGIHGPPAMSLGLLLYFANPLLLQHSLLIDADTTGTILFLMIFVWAFAVCEEKKGKEFILSRIFLALIFALMILSKEVTPILIVAGGLSYRVLRGEWKRLLIDFFAVYVIGTAVFWFIWWLYCVFTQTDIWVFIKYTLLKKTPRAVNQAHLTKVFQDLTRILRWPLFWVSAPFFIWYAFAVVSKVLRFFKKRKIQPEDFLILISLAVWIPYIAAKPTIDMMKYQHPVYPLMIISMVLYAAHLFRNNGAGILEWLRGRNWFVPLIVVLFFVLLTRYFQIGDYLKLMWDSSDKAHWKAFINNYYRPLVLGLVIAFTVSFFAKVKVKKTVIALCVLFIFPIQSALTWHQTAPYTTAESWMNYGESGHFETIEHLRRELPKKSSICIRKDLLYYLNVHHDLYPQKVDIRKILMTRDAKTLVLLFSSGRPEYIVWDKISVLGFTTELMQPAIYLINKFYYTEREFGSFKILRLKPQFRQKV